MAYAPELTTLAYVVSPDGTQVLLVHRNARDSDEQLGKYNGLGGKVERDEDIVQAIRRELLEEAGIESADLELRGTVSWPGFNGRDVFGFVFLVTAFFGTVPKANEEGTLGWHDIATMMQLPMWDGDRHFLPLVFDREIGQFHAVIAYDGGHSTDARVTIVPAVSTQQAGGPEEVEVVGGDIEEELRILWRESVYTRDVEALRLLLPTPKWPRNSLQLIGDGVVITAQEPDPGVEAAARRCVARLNERGWTGDRELVAQIESAMGWAPPLGLEPSPVDLEEITGVLEGDPSDGGGTINLTSGAVWPQELVYNGVAYEEDPDAEGAEWLRVHCQGSREGYHDMELFIEGVRDSRIADRLARSIEGRGAFRRFRDRLEDWPELLDEWYGFRDDRRRGRAREWLADEGYVSVPTPGD